MIILVHGILYGLGVEIEEVRRVFEWVEGVEPSAGSASLPLRERGEETVGVC